MEEEEIIKTLGLYYKFDCPKTHKINGVEIGPKELLAHIRKMIQAEVDDIEGILRY